MCLAGLQFVGTSDQNIVKPMKAGGWKKVHEMINPRYGVDGSNLIVMCKNLNVYRNGKPLYERQKDKRFYG